MTNASNKHISDCPFHGVISSTDKDMTADQKMVVRVGRLEGIVETLAKDMQEMARGMFSMGKELSGLRDIISDKIERVVASINTAARPNWGNIAAWAAIIVTIIGLAGSLVAIMMSGQNTSITDNKIQITELISQQMKFQYEKGKNDSITEGMKEKMHTLDTNLQKEIAMINATTEAKIKGLDDKLQIEFIGLNRSLGQQVETQKEDISTLRTWRLEFVSKQGELEGRVTSKQNMVEDRLKAVEGMQQSRLQIHEALDINKSHNANNGVIIIPK